MVGELSLDGAIRPIRGALSIADCARKQGIANLVLPLENAAEAAVVEGLNVYGVRHLPEAVELLKKPEEFSPVMPLTRIGASRRTIYPGFCRCSWTNHRETCPASGGGGRP